jgi:hypothetical protein
MEPIRSIYCGDGVIWSKAERLFPVCDREGAISGVKIGAVHHPAALLAFPRHKQ